MQSPSVRRRSNTQLPLPRGGNLPLPRRQSISSAPSHPEQPSPLTNVDQPSAHLLQSRPGPTSAPSPLLPRPHRASIAIDVQPPQLAVAAAVEPTPSGHPAQAVGPHPLHVSPRLQGVLEPAAVAACRTEVPGATQHPCGGLATAVKPPVARRVAKLPSPKKEADVLVEGEQPEAVGMRASPGVVNTAVAPRSTALSCSVATDSAAPDASTEDVARMRPPVTRRPATGVQAVLPQTTAAPKEQATSLAIVPPRLRPAVPPKAVQLSQPMRTSAESAEGAVSKPASLPVPRRLLATLPCPKSAVVSTRFAAEEVTALKQLIDRSAGALLPTAKTGVALQQTENTNIAAELGQPKPIQSPSYGVVGGDSSTQDADGASQLESVPSISGLNEVSKLVLAPMIRVALANSKALRKSSTLTEARSSETTTKRPHKLTRAYSDERRVATAEQMATDLAMKRIRDKMRKGLLNNYREDLSCWITDLLGAAIPTIETGFFDALANGVLLCKMAGTIATAENAYIKDNTTNGAPTLWPLPKFNSRAIPGTFVARDNIHSFIVWSRAFGVPESALFETEDLVAGKKLKNVLYTLMDLARLSHLPTEQLPELIQLEREIDNEIIEDENEDDMISFPPPLRVKPPLPPKPAGLMLRSAAAVEPEPEPVNIDPEPSTRLSLMSVAEITEEDLELLGEDQSVDLDCFDVPEPVLVKKATQMQRRLSMDVIMVPNVVTVPSPVENTALLVETTKVLSMFSSQCDMSTSMSGQGSDHPPISNNNTSNETTTMDDVLALMPDVGVDNNDTPAQETWHPSPEPTITTPEKKPTKVVFVKGDEIDEAVQIMSNQYGGKIKLKRVRKGKYQVSESRRNLFVRILRNHIMVRVGGGWDTLEHYLLTHAPEASHLSHVLLGGQTKDLSATTRALRSQAEASAATPKRTSNFFRHASKQDQTGQIKVPGTKAIVASPIPARPIKRGSKQDLMSPFRRSSSVSLLGPESDSPGRIAMLKGGGSRTSFGSAAMLKGGGGSRTSMGVVQSRSSLTLTDGEATNAKRAERASRSSSTDTNGMSIDRVTPLPDDDYATGAAGVCDADPLTSSGVLAGGSGSMASGAANKGSRRKTSLTAEPLTAGQAAARARLKAASTDFHKGLYKNKNAKHRA